MSGGLRSRRATAGGACGRRAPARWAALRIGLAWVLALAASAAGAGADDDRAGTPNPDPARIAGAPGAATLEVAPRGDAGDYDNLQWAADNVAAGGTIELGAGTFFLGDGKSAPKRTVLLRRGLRLTGRRDGEAWLTVVRGGGEGTCGPSQIESGPFQVVNDADDHPTVFEDLWLREWTAEAVCIEAVRGFAFRRCRLSHPVNTTKEGAIRFVHALWTTGIRARGDFIVEGNLVELGGYDGPLADDEQFMGVFYSNHDTVRVADNVITGIDEAIEIIGNRVDRTARGEGPPARGPAEVVVTDNSIDVTQQPGERWPSTFAILVAGNQGADAVRIEGNDLRVRGKGYAFGLSGDRLRVAGNMVRFESFDGKDPAGVATIGFGELAGLPMGSSLNDSVFEDNTFKGRVREVGIVLRPGRGGETNTSHGNRFALGDSLAKLGAATTIALPPGVHDNVFTGSTGTVVDQSTPGANRY
jgi:hypothetical protein